MFSYEDVDIITSSRGATQNLFFLLKTALRQNNTSYLTGCFVSKSDMVVLSNNDKEVTLTDGSDSMGFINVRTTEIMNQNKIYFFEFMVETMYGYGQLV